MTQLPNDSDFTGQSVTESGFKTAQTTMLAYLRGLLGTDGLAATARSQLGMAGVVINYNNTGAWVTATGYSVNDLATVSSVVYVCQIPHTSGTFSADLAAGKWTIHQGITAADLASSTGADLVKYMPAGIGGTLRTLMQKALEVITPGDRGAIADGVADDASAIGNATADGDVALPVADYFVPEASLAGIRENRLTGGGRIVTDKAATTLESIRDVYTDRRSALAGTGAMLIFDSANTQHADVSAITAALFSGSAKIVFVGDSITENNASQSVYESDWVRQMMMQMDEAFNGITLNYVNMGLGSTRVDNFTDVAFVPGVTNFPVKTPASTFPVGLAHWPAGSTAAKPWHDHIRDELPDLLVFAFGMNHGNKTESVHLADMEAAIAHIRTWPKQPTICLMTPTLPTRLTAPYSTQQAVRTSHNRVTRALAAKHRMLLMDTHRIGVFLRDGVDDAAHYFVREENLLNYASWWTVLNGAPVVSGGTVTATGNWKIMRQIQCRDVVIEATFNITNAAQIPSLYYRVPDGLQPVSNGYAVLWQPSGNIVFYHDSVNLGYYAAASRPLNTNQYLRIECIGTRHRFWLNGVLVREFTDYRSMRDGNYGVGIDGTAGAVANSCTISTRPAFPLRTGRPVLHDDDIVGAVNDWATNADSQGGNAVNHPTILAHGMLYASMIGSVINRISMSLAVASKMVVGKTDINQTANNFVGTGDYIDVYGMAGEIVRADVCFRYHNSHATSKGLIAVYANGISAGDGDLRFLPPTTDASVGAEQVFSVEITLPATGINRIETYWSAGSNLATLESLAATKIHFIRTLRVSRL